MLQEEADPSKRNNNGHSPKPLDPDSVIDKVRGGGPQAGERRGAPREAKAADRKPAYVQLNPYLMPGKHNSLFSKLFERLYKGTWPCDNGSAPFWPSPDRQEQTILAASLILIGLRGQATPFHVDATEALNVALAWVGDRKHDRYMCWAACMCVCIKYLADWHL